MITHSTRMRQTAVYLVFAAVAALAGGLLPLYADDGACAGGNQNNAACNLIQGYSGNGVSGDVVGATIAGGGEPTAYNQVTGSFGTIGGGKDNRAGNQATIAGGADNRAGGYRAAIGGGSSNTAATAYTTIGGGTNNNATGGPHATIGGGTDNTASDLDATVGGGSGNVANFMLATVGGGGYNTASSLDATVAGGSRNTAAGAFSTVAGGSDNRATGFNSTISGGSGNLASGDNVSIGGGLANRATAKYSTIGGGYGNVAGTKEDNAVRYATVGGGEYNTASGFYSTVPGGSSNSAAADYSLAAGRRAMVGSAHTGAILFSDSTNADFASAAANEFAARATGGVRMVTGVDASGTPTSGVRLAPGSGTWESLSDRAAKTNLTAVDSRAVLDRLMNLPITVWSYKTEDPSIRHIGPAAQDFHQFGVGTDEHYISTLDEAGVALAAIQGLYQSLRDELASRDAKIAALQAENAAQQARLADLETRVKLLEQQVVSH